MSDLAAQREPLSRRRKQRLSLPLDVAIDGRRFAAADWSVGGFSVADPDGDWSRGSRHRVELRFPTHDSHWGFDTTAEVANVIDGGRVGFRFPDLLPGQMAQLQALVAACAGGEVVAFDHFLRAAGGRADGTLDEPPAVPGHRLGLGRLLGYGLVLALGLAVLGLATLLINEKLLTIRAEHAAVTVPVVRVRTGVSGVLAGPELAPGTPVPQGAQLFDLANEELLAEIELEEAELARRTLLVEGLRRREADLQAFFGDYERLAVAAMRRAEAALAQANESYRLAERERVRMSELHDAGYLAQARLEQMQQRHGLAARAVLTAEADLDQARANLAMSRRGRFFTGSRVDSGELVRIAEEVREAADTHARQSRQLAVLRERREALRAVSPCDCVVAAVLARRGELIEAGTVVQLLRPRGETPTLAVKVMGEQADRLEIGGLAAVRLPDRPDTVIGSIAAVSHVPPAEPRLGLPDLVERSPRHASVTVRLPIGIADALIPGTPAQVAFPVRAERLFGSVGWKG